MNVVKNEALLENIGTANDVSIRHTDVCGLDCDVYTPSGASALELLPVVGISHDDAAIHIVRVTPSGGVESKVIRWDDLAAKRVRKSLSAWLSRGRPEIAIDVDTPIAGYHHQSWREVLGLVLERSIKNARRSWHVSSPIVDWPLMTEPGSGYQRAAHLAILVIRQRLEELSRCQAVVSAVVATSGNQ